MTKSIKKAERKKLSNDCVFVAATNLVCLRYNTRSGYNLVELKWTSSDAVKLLETLNQITFRMRITLMKFSLVHALGPNL